jgi:2'-5' RNA ligase
MKRLFIALDVIPDDVFLDLYAKLRSNSTRLDRINWVVPDLMHITLKFLGEIPMEKIPDIAERLRIACKNVQPFVVNIGKIGVFGSRYQPRVLWFGVESTETLQHLHFSIEKQMRKQGLPHSIGNFVPHLTLARINKIDEKKRFFQHIKENQTTHIQQFTVNEIILYESILKGREEHCPVYEKVMCCKLENNK